MPRHPLSRFSRPLRHRLFLAGFALCLVLMAVLRALDPPHVAGAPGGVVAFELAGFGGHEAEYVRAWAAAGAIGRARTSIAVDYAFLVAYGVTVALGCLRGAEALAARAPRTARVGVLLAWAAFAAALLDATENTFMLAVIASPERGGPALGAALCASVKFALIGPAVVYALAALLLRRGCPAPSTANG